MLDADWNPPVGMVNLIAGRRIVPELLQQRFTAENVAAALTPLLADTPERSAQVVALAEVRDRLHSDISPIDHAVAAVLDLLHPA
jgi:lipid-A-disaccharide synthase